GTVVGITASASDADATNNTITYSLDDSAGGRFTINSSTGVVTVANSTLLNFEAVASHIITVRATSSDTSFSSANFTISLTDVNEAPSSVSITSAAITLQFDSSSTFLQNSQGSAAVVASNVTSAYDSGRGGVAQFAVGGQFNSTGTIPTLVSNFTLFERFKDLYLSEQGYNTLFRGASEHQLLLNSSTKELGYYDNDGGSGFKGTGYIASALDDGQWHTAAVVNNAGVFSYYIDGAKVGNSISDNSTSTLSTIGGVAGGQTFAKYLDDFRYYGNALSATQVAALSTDTESSLTVVENAANGTYVGTAIARDLDAATTLTYSLTDSAGGRFAIHSSNGGITVANSSLLNFESNTAHTIVVQATDQLGLSYSQTVTINVSDVNDAPTAMIDTSIATEAGGVSNGTPGSNPTGNVLTNDTDQDAGDTKTVSGVAAGVVASASTNVSSNVIGSYGTINIAANGAYTYTVDNSNATVQALRTTAGTLQDVFTYTMRDTSGLTSTTQITITIQGANDAPTDISGTLTIAENSANGSTVGTVNTTDVDSGDSFTYTLTNNAGGRFSINATSGQVTVANGTLLDFESSSTHTIVVQSTDAAGASFTKTMTVAVTNANDRPIAVADTATAVEAGGVANATAGTNPTGNVLTNDTDVDGGDTKTVSGVAAGTVALASTNVGSSVTGTYGSITISSAGAYAYTVDNSNAAVQALRTSANTLADVFTYTMRDTAGLTSTTQITVTIQGANDAPNDITGTLSVAENSSNSTGVGVKYENRLRYSERFEVVNWALVGGAITANAGIAPDGTQTADRYTGGSGSSIRQTTTDSFTAGTTMTFSLYVKADGRSSLILRADNTGAFSGDAGRSYDLINLTSTAVYGTSTGTITDVGNGWRLLTVSAVADRSGTFTAVLDGLTNGAETGGYLIWGAQVNVGTDNPYSATTASSRSADISLTVADVDSGDNVTYALLDTAGGRFAVNSSTGLVTVANGSLLDFEAAASHNITVR
ncbi:MAG: beta strand repeat-containing protein, partial [Pirellula sp.]